MIKDFHTYLISKEMSTNTIKSYTQHVQGFLKWFDESKDLSFKKLHRENVRDYISYLKTVKKAKSTSVNAKVGALIKLNEFLLEKGIQSDQVVSKKDNIKVQKQYASLAKIEIQDVERFRQLILDNESNKRNHTIVTLLAYTGLRISEALQIRMDDFNLISRELVVRQGKGEKLRKVFINDKVASALKEWLKERPKIESEFLFLSNHGNKLDRTVVNRLFKKYSKALGKDITPHDLRHFFCSYALSKGFTVHEVANQAGHTNIHTTLLYTNPSKNELLSKMNKL